MKRAKILLILFLFSGISVYAQKMNGFGAEISVLSVKANARMWFSKTTGVELFGGLSSQVDQNFKPNDPEAGFKFLHAIQYSRSERLYIGLVGKWKWVDVNDSNISTSLPVPGVLIGKEWYSKRINRKGFAVELGYQFGVKEYQIYSPTNHLPIGDKRFEEFPLILNIRYSFYHKK